MEKRLPDTGKKYAGTAGKTVLDGFPESDDFFKSDDDSGAQIAEAVRTHQKDMGKEEVQQRVTELMQLVEIEQAGER